MRRFSWGLWAMLLISATQATMAGAQGAERGRDLNEEYVTNGGQALCFGLILLAAVVITLVFHYNSSNSGYQQNYSSPPPRKPKPPPPNNPGSGPNGSSSGPNRFGSGKSEIRNRKTNSQAEKKSEKKTTKQETERAKYDMEGARLALTLCVTVNREGAEKDLTALERMFEALGFQNQVIRDPKATGFKEELQKFRKEIDPRTNPSCCFVVLMAHTGKSKKPGDRSVVLGADGEEMELEELFAEMTNKTCKALQGKPKVFIIQACRGDIRDKGVCMKNSDPTDNLAIKGSSASTHSTYSYSNEPNDMKLIPTHTDSLFIYASVPGYVAYRHKQDGSYLIQTIAEVFKESRGYHILDLLTEVIQRVSEIDFLEGGNQQPKYKMNPVFQSSLRQLLFLKESKDGRSLPPRPSSHLCHSVVTDDSAICVQRPVITNNCRFPEKPTPDLLQDNEKPILENKPELQRYQKQSIDRYNMGGAHLALTLCVTVNREGAEKDLTALERMFGALGFQNQVIRDPKATDFKEKLQQFRKEIDDREDPISCCFVILMAHGNRETVCGADGKDVKLEELFAEMTNEKCKALQGKPKVFIIQACRGGNIDSGIPVEDGVAVDFGAAGSLSLSPGNDKLIPTHTDSLFIYASTPGYIAYRHEQDGSYLIQTIAEVFKKSRGYHVLELLTKVIQRVSEIDFLEGGNQQPKYKMNPVFQSSLRQLLFLKVQRTCLQEF